MPRNAVAIDGRRFNALGSGDRNLTAGRIDARQRQIAMASENSLGSRHRQTERRQTLRMPAALA